MRVCVHTYMHGIDAHMEAKGPLAAVASPLLCGSQGWSINFTVTHLYSLSHLAALFIFKNFTYVYFIYIISPFPLLPPTPQVSLPHLLKCMFFSLCYYYISLLHELSNLLSPFVVAYMYVFRADYLVVNNQLGPLSLGITDSSSLNIH